jgi:wyosine [tRNA(Phe)-imidazoG37] synthetase (radical SAM superfamily)
MEAGGYHYLYGPVSSRRLGRSLGLDVIPQKTCTYDCIYCQLGKTTKKTVERREYVPIDIVLEELDRKLAEKPELDYISLAGSGEPTLNSRIGDLIAGIKARTAVPIAVFTNGALLWMPEVRQALLGADLVLPSLDAGDEHLFRYVNRPHRGVSFEKMVDGLIAFRKEFRGQIWLEVFLLAGVSGMNADAERIARLSERIGADRVQLNTATRPPAEDFAYAMSRESMERLREEFGDTAEVVADLVHAAEEFTGDATDAEILALIQRHPCTAREVASALNIGTEETTRRLDELTRTHRIARILQNGKCFHLPVGQRAA